MRKWIVFLFTVYALLASAFVVSATDTEMLSAPTRTLSEERKSEIVKHIKLELVDNDNYKTGIASFAVSENGLIAVAIENDRIYVYDSNGVFQYGYYFNGDGAYGVVFAGENVAIYFVRGDFFAIYDSSGDCVAIKELTAPDYERISRFLHRTTIQRSDKTCTLERDLEFSGTYSRLVITDTEGNRKVLYDISTQHSIGVVLPIMGIIGLFAFAIWGIWKQRQELESMEGIWYCSELKMQVSLDDYQNAFFMDNGERIWCKCYLSVAKITVLEVFCREYEHPKYRYGKTILVGDVKFYDGMSMRVYGRRSRREYTFVRTDKIG